MTTFSPKEVLANHTRDSSKKDSMTTKEIVTSHDRGFLEKWSKDRARSAYLGDSVLCRSLGRYNLYVDPDNTDMTPWLMLDGFWESWVSLAMARAIQPGWTCIDGGAWCGYFTLLMADIVGPTGKVFAFEPNERHWPMLNRSIKANGFEDRAFPLLRAIGEKNGTGRFIVTPEGGGSRLVDGRIGTRDVDVYTLDDFDFKGKVDFIKLDIEGGEEKAWQGMQQLLSRNPQCIIVMEWEPARYEHPEDFADSVCAFAAPREITTDGSTTPINRDQLLQPGMRMIWLQK